jgi:hypothetical protein
VSERPDRWIHSALAPPSVITSPDLIRGSVPVIPIDSRRLVPLAVSLGPRAPQRHHRACPGDLDCLKRCAFPHRDGRDKPGHDEEDVVTGAGTMCVKEPAPVGPQLALRA